MQRRRIALLAGILAATIGLVARPGGRAGAVDSLCFDVPGITNCVSGAFRTYWERAGGLNTFGYPLTPPGPETTPDGTYTVQYFERVRFEFHPENEPDYQVQLGRLGAELYAVNPRPERPDEDCLYFDQTGFNLCDPFLTKWQSISGEPGAGSLDLYGQPISPVILRVGPDGEPISVQWFERARFELHQGNLILLGLLGREALASDAAPPSAPQPAPPEEPPPDPTAVPPPSGPAPIKVPFPERPCHINVPAPVEGIQSWVTLPEVGPPYDEVVCMRLIVNGEPAHPAFVNIYRHEGDTVIPGIGHTTGLDGTTGFIFYVGDTPLNATIPVEVVATFEGREYRTWTSFIRR